ncbi:MAG: AAA family ATPase [Alistipes sp.]|nr:AAA family ATPase [Alistipes sp.]
MNDNLITQLREDTMRLCDELRREQEAENQTFRKYLVNGYEMLISPTEELECLLEPILPRVGVTALVGTSDSGKSTLLRGLAMAVASGAGHYLDFKLNPRHGRAIYVSTEDDVNAVSSLMRKQIAELGTPHDAYSTLDFIFDTENLVDTLDKSLEERPADLVVIDAFADLYTGPLNENNRVRSYLNVFSQLAQRHSTLIIFLHHTGKRTEVLSPSKHNAIGSQGFEAKMRVMFELRHDPVNHDLRHLCVVKGNYLPKEFKHESFVLMFTPGLNFIATGDRVPFGALKERDAEVDDRLAQARALRDQGMTLQQIADALGYKSASGVYKLLERES